jgi:phage terminase small subunit
MDLQESNMTKKDVWNVPPVRGDKLQKRLTGRVGSLRSQRRTLTSREWTFVQELVSGDGKVTMKECAIRAGWSEKSAKATAWKLTNPELSPHVVAAIQEYRAELNAKYGTNYDRHMKDLQLIRDKALEAGAYSAAVAAEYRRGQALGTIYVDRKEIRVGTIDSMSKEEVMRKLEEIKRIYGAPPQNIIDMESTDVVKTIEVEPEFDAEKVIEDGNKARSRTVQKTERESTGSTSNENRIESESRDTRLSDSIEVGQIHNGGAESSEEG